ncbi:hypothetical protein K435DRAFT_793120 [Dendrothele bispora CBS 962.96]|uniref:Uncharacterized protein n=1 Tax=Dendrothele bispora (strain CBS 962.96) TaxID=1314807 RepID=A0A4S8MG63_DENBC|nr:hypothetical protein K435DRAFT_793120 [Dendrothele bispora CBS 962.96]
MTSDPTGAQYTMYESEGGWMDIKTVSGGEQASAIGDENNVQESPYKANSIQPYIELLAQKDDFLELARKRINELEDDVRTLKNSEDLQRKRIKELEDDVRTLKNRLKDPEDLQSKSKKTTRCNAGRDRKNLTDTLHRDDQRPSEQHKKKPGRR